MEGFCFNVVILFFVNDFNLGAPSVLNLQYLAATGR